jgi:tripeptidyl-peptidase-1
VYEPESACEQQIFSGGGFSNIFDMPAYQKHAVSKYLKHHAPPYTAEQFNNSGQVKMRLRFELNAIRADTPARLAGSRIYPLTGQAFATIPSCRPIDLSHSANYVVAVDGNFTLVFGTSASAPVVGAIITLINDARIDLGKGPIGASRSLFSPSCRLTRLRAGFLNELVCAL